MNSTSTTPLEVIKDQIAQHEARIATINLLIENRPMAYEDLRQAYDVLGLLRHELERWKALGEAVQRSKL